MGLHSNRKNAPKEWAEKIGESPKAISYNKFKSNIEVSPHLKQNMSPNYRITFSRFRLSNHSLWIEKGSHMNPKIDRDMRFCNLCKTLIEDECHFIITCPLYSKNRIILENACKNQSKWYNTMNTEQKFIFIMSNENKTILKILCKFIFNLTTVRNKILEYFFS